GEDSTSGNEQVTSPEDAAIAIHHSGALIGPHPDRTDLVNAISGKLHDAAYALSSRKLPDQLPKACCLQPSGKMCMGAHYAFGIPFAEPQIEHRFAQAEHVALLRKPDPRLGVRQMLRMKMKRIAHSRIVKMQAGKPALGKETP